MRARAARDRPHGTPRRQYQLYLRCSADEYEIITAAAALAGLTPGGYAAEATLAAARHRDPPLHIRTVLVELMQARTQLRRYGNNVNQAVRALNTTGEPPDWLQHAAVLTTGAVEHIDVLVARRARRH